MNKTLLTIASIITLTLGSFGQQATPAPAPVPVEAAKDSKPSALSIGKEVGIAIGEAVKQIGTTVEQFSESNVGKTTTYIIAWKLFGDDVKWLLDKFIAGFLRAFRIAIILAVAPFFYKWVEQTFMGPLSVTTKVFNKGKENEYEETSREELSGDAYGAYCGVRIALSLVLLVSIFIAI